MSDAQTPSMGNLSALNPKDAALMGSSGITPQTTIRDFYARFGVDVDGPVTQLQKLAQSQIANRTTQGKLQAAPSLKPGGQPQMPGRNPMVQPQGQPPAAGLEGLMNRLGG